MPAPRSCRAGKVSASTCAPVAAEIRLAASIAGRVSPVPPSRIVHQRSGIARAPQRPRGAHDTAVRHRRWFPPREWRRHHRVRPVSPRHIGGEDERGDLAGRAQSRCDGVRCVGWRVLAAGRSPHPSRHRPRERVDVGLQRRVEPLVICRVIPDDSQQRGVRAARIVQVGQPVRQTRSEVQQCGGRLPGHPAEAVGRAGSHPLKQAQHAAHLGHCVQCRDEVHLRRTGVGEARRHAAADQRADDGLGSVHGLTPRPGACLAPGPSRTRRPVRREPARCDRAPPVDRDADE